MIRSVTIALLLCLPRVAFAQATPATEAHADPAAAPEPRAEPAAARKAHPESASAPEAHAESATRPEAHPESATRPEAHAQSAAAPEPGAPADTPQATSDREMAAGRMPLEHHRAPVDVLMERMLGSASKSVRFDWRKSRVGFGVVGSELLERNNFKSGRLGGFARMPLGGGMGEVAITRAFTRGSASTDQLALTPYRQVGRPSRLELDLNWGYPVAEGVVTAWPGFFPATELVFSLDAGVRYLFYPGALSGASFSEVAKSILAPQLLQHELDALEGSRPGGMQIDTARYGLMTGASLDLYFQNGAFLSPRVLIAIPLLEPITGTGLGWWWELSLALGWTL